MTETLFNHSGNLGDILYSLLFAMEFSEALSSDFKYNIQLYRPATYTEKHPYGDVMMNEAAASFLTPLLKTVCKDVTTSIKIPDGCFDLSVFRQFPINYSAGEIRLWYYQLVGIPLKMDLQRKLIDVEPNESVKDKIVVIKSSRYNNCFFDWRKLEEFKDSMLFIGLDEEHEAFCKDFFNVERFEIKDALEAAKVIAGAKLTIGNPSGLFSIAETMKTPRCLVTPEFIRYKDRAVPGPVNVIPQGGFAVMAATVEKAVETVKAMLQ